MNTPEIDSIFSPEFLKLPVAQRWSKMNIAELIATTAVAPWLPHDIAGIGDIRTADTPTIESLHRAIIAKSLPYRQQLRDLHASLATLFRESSARTIAIGQKFSAHNESERMQALFHPSYFTDEFESAITQEVTPEHPLYHELLLRRHALRSFRSDDFDHEPLRKHRFSMHLFMYDDAFSGAIASVASGTNYPYLCASSERVKGDEDAIAKSISAFAWRVQRGMPVSEAIKYCIPKDIGGIKLFLAGDSSDYQEDRKRYIEEKIQTSPEFTEHFEYLPEHTRNCIIEANMPLTDLFMVVRAKRRKQSEYQFAPMEIRVSDMRSLYFLELGPDAHWRHVQRRRDAERNHQGSLTAIPAAFRERIDYFENQFRFPKHKSHTGQQYTSQKNFEL